MNLLSFFSQKPRESIEEKELFNTVGDLNSQHKYAESIEALKDKPRWIAKNAKLKVIYSDALFLMAESIQSDILKSSYSKEEETNLNKTVTEYFRECVKQGKQAKEAKNYGSSFNIMKCYFFGLGLNINREQAMRYGSFCWDKMKDERALPYLYCLDGFNNRKLRNEVKDNFNSIVRSGNIEKMHQSFKMHMESWNNDVQRTGGKKAQEDLKKATLLVLTAYLDSALWSYKGLYEVDAGANEDGLHEGVFQKLKQSRNLQHIREMLSTGKKTTHELKQIQLISESNPNDSFFTSLLLSTYEDLNPDKFSYEIKTCLKRLSDENKIDDE